MNEKNMLEVSFEELLAQIGGSTEFGKDELIEMIAYQDDHDEDFYIHHRHKTFKVPLYKIREFFTRNPKPVPPMTKDQELIYLRDKVKKLQAEAEAQQGMAKTVPDGAEDLEEPVTPGDDIGSNVVDGVEKGKLKVVPPERDVSIPPPQDRKKQSLKEIRADLAKELKGVKNPSKKTTESAVPKDIKGREALVEGLVKNK